MPVNKPEEYLKKHSKEVKISPTKPTAKKLPEDLTAPRKPRVPTLHDKPQMAVKTNKDFIKTNAISTITAVPKKPQPKYVDSPKGTSFPLEESGLLPHYINKKTYGKVPIYLETRRNEMAEAQAEYEKFACAEVCNIEDCFFAFLLDISAKALSVSRWSRYRVKKGSCSWKA